VFSVFRRHIYDNWSFSDTIPGVLVFRRAVLYPVCGLLGVLYYILSSGFWFVYTMGRARWRRFHAHDALCRSWRAIRSSSFFAPLKHRLSCSPAQPIVRSVPAHITLHLFVSTHFALHRGFCTLHTLPTLPTQPSVGTYNFFPDARASSHGFRDRIDPCDVLRTRTHLFIVSWPSPFAPSPSSRRNKTYYSSALAIPFRRSAHA
jgi:hypothetical protein